MATGHLASLGAQEIPREDFLELVETEPAFALHLLRELARRLVEARATA